MSDGAHLFERLKKVNKNTNHLIHGYLREYEQRIFGELSKLNPYYNFPQIMPNICMIYYYITDKWDMEAIGPKYKVTKNGRCVDTVVTTWESAFGTEICSSPGQYYWKFRLNKVANISSDSYWCIVLGIWKIKSNPSPIINDYWTSAGKHGTKDHEYGYAYDVISGTLVNAAGNNAMTGGNYGIKCKQGDIIEMCLDFDKRTLGFIINDKDMGPSHTDIEDTEYRLAVSTFRQGSSIEILD